jgi:hypothetical protein
MQTCLRLAISPGAGVIVMSPHSSIMPPFQVKSHIANTTKLAPIATRTEKDLLDYPNEQCPDELWNIDLFQHSLSTSCNDTSGIDVVLEAKYRKYLDPSHYNNAFRALIDDTIKSSLITRADISSQTPVRIVYGDPYLAWNCTASIEGYIKKDLFKTLKYNTSLLGFGSQVFQALRKISMGPVVAIHFRGEADWPGGFGDPQMQVTLYTEALEKLRQDERSNLKDVYVSCGSVSAIQNFREY